jgi:hypothetical protein
MTSSINNLSEHQGTEQAGQQRMRLSRCPMKTLTSRHSLNRRDEIRRQTRALALGGRLVDKLLERLMLFLSHKLLLGTRKTVSSIELPTSSHLKELAGRVVRGTVARIPEEQEESVSVFLLSKFVTREGYILK